MMPALVSGLTPLARVAIDAGTFAMGSPLFHNTEPVTDVTVSAFEITETKMTIGAYREYLRAIGENRVTLAVTNPETEGVSIVGRGKTQAEVLEAYVESLPSRMSPGARIELGGLTIFEVTDPDLPPEFRVSLDQPQGQIDWWETLAFAAAHGGDLPTEAEYERVQRGRSGKDEYGTVSGGLWAEDGRLLAEFGQDQTSPVKKHAANSWGVRDASGNVWVWTRTWYAASYEGLEPKDPRGPKREQEEERVLRGGAFSTGELLLRAVFRYSSHPTQRSEEIGGVVVWRY